jgi:excinuclease ABC subunit A
VRILQRLRDQGNTVVVVEHEASVMRAADQIVDIGPGHGESGGQIVFQGPFADALKSKTSLTGQYLSGHKRVEIPPRRPVALHEPGANALSLTHATLHNLQDVSVEIPLGRFVGITGVSGSGKTTLIREVLLPALEAKLKATGPALTEATAEDDTSDSSEETGETRRASATVTGWEKLGRVVLVDQASLGKTPRSNPAVYIGAFEDIRDLFAQSELAKQRGLNSSAFSFNSGQGQCERCRGVGFEKIEMQFLSDVFIRCPECNGRRYRPHILEVKIGSESALKEWSIADLLEATVDEVVQFLAGFADSRPAKRAGESLKLLQEVGLGYLRLGQPINTLSGGESQRLKLVRHLAEFTEAESAHAKPTLFLFDEPTTGLHFDDVRVLLNVFQRLVDAGHSVLVIEHNLDVIKCADWLIDLGPDAGDQGGRVIAQGTPEQLSTVQESHTGQALQACLQPNGKPNSRKASE